MKRTGHGLQLVRTSRLDSNDSSKPEGARINNALRSLHTQLRDRATCMMALCMLLQHVSSAGARTVVHMAKQLKRRLHM